MQRSMLAEKVAHLHRELHQMGMESLQSLKSTLIAIDDEDMERSKQVIEQDATINQYELSINDAIVEVLVTQQPVATDLRTLTAMMKVTADYERLGDLSVEIAKSNLHRAPFHFSAYEKGILLEMGEYCIAMAEEAMEAFHDLDLERVMRIEQSDVVVDDLYGRAIREFILNGHDERAVIQLAYIARSLERIGDHCTNIAEQVMYVKKGIHFDLNRPTIV
ncbi:phosphate signaling complex protein PhoU [Geomicrobium sediminis]|uniref:Phosphate-specific transport system accessory protein PhoU n=1 Tax=Geomicrobium sediminis TaxID=1347788 RepID=A0ABS2P8L6_9BACL|nr:phosphate signaling complex protein PhoU [Geomicrobium sediminis]MBM7631652.1 phosphate transport system protein [Geomicrobium sediminis]